MTIIVDGGYYTPETILNDLKANRAVVIVDGSGRMANLLAMFLKNTTNEIETE